MALEFTIAESRYKKIHKDKWVPFPDKIRAYLDTHKSDFSSGITILLSFDEYGDTLLYREKMEILIQLCAEIQKSTDDYSVFDKCKLSGITKDELLVFSIELSELLQFAIDNGEFVLSVGD